MAGFTLIELLVVISIIAVLAGLGMAAAVGVQRSSKKQLTRSLVVAVRDAIGPRPPALSFPISGGDVVLVPAWDINRDGWIDGDPELDPPAPSGAGQEFTAVERTQAAAAGYRGLVRGVGGIAVPKGHLDAYGRILDSWRNPLRIAYAIGGYPAFAGASFAGAAVGIYSMGPDRGDDAGRGDDITSWGK